MKNKLFDKLMVLICSILVITSIIMVIIYNIRINKDNIIEVVNTEEIIPLSESDSYEATFLVKNNIVKVVNKINDNTSIIGTGFFDKSGYLVTNSHIVDIKGDISVIFPSGKSKKSNLYSNDIKSDIALLEVENDGLKAMHYSDTMLLRVTDEVYSIGYPYNLDGEASVTKGILSARRSAVGIEFLQSDISLNVGNSGGPLINDKGEFLGINTYATDNASIGISISSESLQNIIDKLINDNKINYIEEKRPQNALSVVLNEIGYEYSDIYNEEEIIPKENSNENIYNDEGNGKNHSNNGNHNGQTVVKKKSSNSFLSSISIDNYKIEFDVFTYDYYITLKNDESSLNISATTEDKLSNYTISGNSNFIDGINKVTIAVKAEDGSTTNYIINVTKPLRYLDGIAGILCVLDTRKYNGVNSLVVSGCDFVDSDKIRINSNIPLDVIESVKLDLYAGWNNDNVTGANIKNVKLNDNGLRFLKSYSFSPSYSYGMPLSEIRSLLYDEDYEGGLYEGADLTVYVTIKTRKQGSYSEIKPWGLSK